MKRSRLFRCILVQALAWTLMLAFVGAAAPEPLEENRFNVAVVVDASGSMKSTDPEKYRFRAITQFVNLLAERGNWLGSVIFHTDVAGGEGLTRLDSQTDKKNAVAAMEAVPADGDWTNIGAGLERAVSMLKSEGDASLPSVILLLSDGNTDMATPEERKASLDRKAGAIQAARESRIPIYSVCLNANRTADVAEMRQISEATGGSFQEVTAAQDLQDTFNAFYELIYGATTFPLADDVFPASGRLEIPFDVPGLGVEEVNIIVYGSASKLFLNRPDGSLSDAVPQVYQDFSMMKLTEIIPGSWTLVTEGTPGDSIKINLVYNTNLGVQLSAEPDRQILNPADAVTFTARLTEGGGAAGGQDCTGYSAELLVMDAYGEVLESLPMEAAGDSFVLTRSFGEGAYYYKAAVSGNHIARESARLGPLSFSEEAATGQELNNTPPVPVKEVVEATVKVWPIKGGSYTLDLNTLASDGQDETLEYRILSSSFLEGEDYAVDGDGVLHMDHFSLSKGAFTIRATDSGGLYCDIEVIVRALNIGKMTLLGMLLLALLGAAVLGVLLYLALTKPFRGDITVQSYAPPGAVKSAKRSPRRGRCKLSLFGLDNVGLDYRRCYFQASGKNYIDLCTNLPVIYNGQETKKVRIASGMRITVTARRGEARNLQIYFESRMRTGYRGAARGKSSRPPRRNQPLRR